MTHLYEATAWTIDEPAQSREYVLHSNGEQLALFDRIAIRRPEDAAMPYANPHAERDGSRIVVCAMAPDGTKFFYVDWSQSEVAPQPAYVVAPDNSLIGAVSVSTGGGGLKGTLKLISGRIGTQYVINDAYGRSLATMAFPPRQDPGQEGTVTDASGEEIARFGVERSPYSDRRRRSTMRLHRALPEPLRTLMFASLVGVELMIPSI